MKKTKTSEVPWEIQRKFIGVLPPKKYAAPGKRTNSCKQNPVSSRASGGSIRRDRQR